MRPLERAFLGVVGTVAGLGLGVVAFVVCMVGLFAFSTWRDERHARSVVAELYGDSASVTGCTKFGGLLESVSFLCHVETPRCKRAFVFGETGAPFGGRPVLEQPCSLRSDPPPRGGSD